MKTAGLAVWVEVSRLPLKAESGEDDGVETKQCMILK